MRNRLGNLKDRYATFKFAVEQAFETLEATLEKDKEEKEEEAERAVNSLKNTEEIVSKSEGCKNK